MLAEGGVGPLPRAARLARMLLIRELEAYRDRGVFPKNHHVPGRRPTFIDEHGTRCAMAHLMELGGAGALVTEVAREANHAYVDDLAADQRFTSWLAAAGLSVAEAARIQPSYIEQCMSAAEALCMVAPASPTAIVPGVFEATIVEGTGGPLLARVEMIYGNAPFAVGYVIQVVSSKIELAVGDRVLGTVEPSVSQNGFATPANHVLARILPGGDLDAPVGSAPGSYYAEIGYLTVSDVVLLRGQASREACRGTLAAKDLCFDACQGLRGPNGVLGGLTKCFYAKPDAGTVEVDAGVLDAGVDAAPAPTDAGVDAAPGRDAAVPSYGGDAPAPPASVLTAPPENEAGLNLAGGGANGCSAAGGDAASAASVAVLLAVAGAILARQTQSRRRS